MIQNGPKLVELLTACCTEDELQKIGRGEGDHISVYTFMFSTTVYLERAVLITRDSRRKEKG